MELHGYLLGLMAKLLRKGHQKARTKGLKEAKEAVKERTKVREGSQILKVAIGRPQILVTVTVMVMVMIIVSGSLPPPKGPRVLAKALG